LLGLLGGRGSVFGHLIFRLSLFGGININIHFVSHDEEERRYAARANATNRTSQKAVCENYRNSVTVVADGHAINYDRLFLSFENAFST
jgi:hypothetical protein